MQQVGRNGRGEMRGELRGDCDGRCVVDNKAERSEVSGEGNVCCAGG